MLENRRKWMFQVYKRTTKPSLHVFCSIHMISNRFDDAYLCWQAHSLFSQMLVSFRSTFTNTPRNNILPSIWVSIPQPSQVGTKLSMTPNLGYLEMSSILFFFHFLPYQNIIQLYIYKFLLSFLVIPFQSNSQVKELTAIFWMAVGSS